MRVTDYIAERLYKEGIEDVFMVTGGGMMFLSDGIASHPKIRAVCNHHEQASAMAAVGYAKYTGKLGVAYVSTGCGATNAITGLLNAWQDSTPVLFLSGQVKKKETVRNSGLKLRQVGVQEADIISIVESICKYSVMVNDPLEIPYHVEKALYLARHGRKGPVWIDIPADVQGAQIDLAKCKKFKPAEMKHEYKAVPTATELSKVEKMLSAAKRPVIIAGQGVRLAEALPEFRAFINKYKIPVVVPFLGVTTLPTAHPQYIGVIGTKGTRGGNIAMQNADLVISMGSKLHVSAIGFEYHLWAREAKKIIIDIDPVEHQKKTITPDLFVNSDIKEFLKRFKMKPVDLSWWGKFCLNLRKKYPPCLPEYKKNKKGISMYYFVDELTKQMKPDATVISDAGSAFYVTSQAMNVRADQRYITSGGQAEMGWTLPAAIGACVARGDKEVLGITGDGSFQMNIQEIQTLVHYKFPVKLFVWNNNGYLSMRTTQSKFFNGRLIGAGPSSGVTLPDTKKIADAYGIKYFKLAKSATLPQDLKKVLAYKGGAIVEVMCDENDAVLPTVSSMRRDDGSMVSKPLEDMFPFLDRKEFLDNMIVKPLEE